MKKISIIMILLLAYNLNAQELFDRLKKKVDETVNRVSESESYRRIEEKVKEINPTEYLSNIINTRLQIYNPLDGLHQKSASINKMLNDNFSFTKSGNAIISPYFRYSSTKKKSGDINFLTDGKLKQFGYKLKIDNNEYLAYSVENKIFIQSIDNTNIPLTNILDKGLELISYKVNSTRLNAVYFGNVKNISEIIYYVASASNRFCSAIQNELENIANVEYAGISAIQVLNPVTEAASGGISYSDIMSFTRDFNNKTKAVMTSADNIQKAANNISRVLNQFNNNTLNYQSVQTLQTSMSTLANEIRNLSSSVNNISSAIRNSGEDFSKLSNVTRFKFFSTIGNALNELSNFSSGISNSLNSYAGKFNSFVSGGNNYASNQADISRTYLTQRVMAKYEKTINSNRIILSDYAEIDSICSEENYYSEFRYSAYIASLSNLNKKYETSISSNLIAAVEALNKTEKELSNFPESDYKDYLHSVAQQIKNDQIISIPDDSKFISSLQSIQVLKNNSFVESKAIQASLIDLLDTVKSSNRNFYLTILILCLLIVGISYIVIRNRKSSILKSIRKKTGDYNG